MTEQLSLFGEENTLFNTGVQQLLDMDFTGCLETMERYGKLFTWGRDVRREVKLADFWAKRHGGPVPARINAAEAERSFKLWLEFEEVFDYPWPKDSIEMQFQRSYFSRLADRLAAAGNDQVTKLPGGTPLGLLYLMASRPDSAIASLQALIAFDSENAGAYGYLGDGYLLRGDLRTARICYREAFVMAPGQLDLKRLQDRELKERLEELQGDEMLDGDPLEWFAVVAQLDGLFERRVFRDLEEVKEWLKRYLDLIKVYRNCEDQALVPRLFYYAMVLSDNSSMMRFIRKVDLPEVRRKMKEWQPMLFARHMRELGAKTASRKPPFA